MGRLRIFGRLGALLGASWERPRTLLGRLGMAAGATWAPFGRDWYGNRRHMSPLGGIGMTAKGLGRDWNGRTWNPGH